MFACCAAEDQGANETVIVRSPRAEEETSPEVPSVQVEVTKVEAEPAAANPAPAAPPAEAPAAAPEEAAGTSPNGLFRFPVTLGAGKVGLKLGETSISVMIIIADGGVAKYNATCKDVKKTVQVGDVIVEANGVTDKTQIISSIQSAAAAGKEQKLVIERPAPA
eukprot:TRINITY_DN23508_c0_g1_i1.p1 TRINITY_DN23508_c0_g1~~TRINITY_DN23508_c0_g1_i1.p1  ORF type:complete len:164 (+),score=54.98 TRINITY_DN23508_c0_g1_i1:76-567(+)